MQLQTLNLHPERELPPWLRILLILVGTFFMLVGLIMLAIPILPQVWAFALAAMCFSLASQTVWRWLEYRLVRWPGLHTRACRLRGRMLDRLNRRRA